jgi:phosphorylcholine metabolism protein LicD
MGKLKWEVLRSSPKMQQFFNSIYDESEGFGDQKQVAINLLRAVTQMLDEEGLTYFLISGTLLGYVRHNDFIPWDDDIDLIVERRVFDMLPQLKAKHNEVFHFICADYMTYLKVSCKQQGRVIPGEQGLKHDFCLDKMVENRWPFVDLFAYDVQKDGSLRFFHQNWDPKQFFPSQRVAFHEMEVSIPANPDHFLQANYGSHYMTQFQNYKYSHKDDQLVLERPATNDIDG